MRLTFLAIAFVVLSGFLATAQTREEPNPAGRIIGTVLDQRGLPLKRIFVHAILEQTGMYMPTAETDDAGRFAIEGLEVGTYRVFGESDAAGYPDTALSFYSKETLIALGVGYGEPASVILVLGPVAGVLTGTVVDKATRKPVVTLDAVHFTVKKISDPDDDILFLGPAKFRWLIPPDVDVTLEVSAEGYKPWSGLLPIRLRSGEDRPLKIELEPEMQSALDR
jgi:hypothetical protein